MQLLSRLIASKAWHLVANFTILSGVVFLVGCQGDNFHGVICWGSFRENFLGATVQRRVMVWGSSFPGEFFGRQLSRGEFSRGLFRGDNFTGGCFPGCSFLDTQFNKVMDASSPADSCKHKAERKNSAVLKNVCHHGWPAKKTLGFRWSKKAEITLETTSFWQNISISIFKFSPFLSIKSYQFFKIYLTRW